MAAVKTAVIDYTAGSPVEEGRLWTNRSPREIAEELHWGGLSIGVDTVRRILTSPHSIPGSLLLCYPLPPLSAVH